MVRFSWMAIMAGSIALAAAAPAVVGSKQTAPVTIVSQRYDTVSAGEVLTARIEFVASQRLDLLHVTAAPYKGLELIGTQTTWAFDNVSRGATRAIEVDVRLTDPEVGYLSIIARTEGAFGKATKAATVAIGSAGDQTKQQLRSSRLKVTEDGERLIIFQGQPR